MNSKRISTTELEWRSAILLRLIAPHVPSSIPISWSIEAFDRKHVEIVLAECKAGSKFASGILAATTQTNDIYAFDEARVPECYKALCLYDLSAGLDFCLAGTYNPSFYTRESAYKFACKVPDQRIRRRTEEILNEDDAVYSLALHCASSIDDYDYKWLNKLFPGVTQFEGLLNEDEMNLMTQSLYTVDENRFAEGLGYFCRSEWQHKPYALWLASGAVARVYNPFKDDPRVKLPPYNAAILKAALHYLAEIEPNLALFLEVSVAGVVRDFSTSATRKYFPKP